MKETPKKRVLFLFSDTGGGHRAATEAMIEALDLEYPGAFTTAAVDFLRDYFPSPLKYAPEIYSKLSKVPSAWGLPYEVMDGGRRVRTVTKVAYPYIRRGMQRLLRENPADLIVSVHPLANNTLVRSMKKHPSPFITVVTDMVSTHAFWFDRHADLVVVPTDLAKSRGIHFGISEGNLRVIGLPVADKFNQPMANRAAWRRSHGWDRDIPVALLVGGGDGMGPVLRVAKAVNNAEVPIQLAVICGRNASLKADLEAINWKIPAHIYGFTTEMPQFMGASDILVTKAGPGTICEGFISGLPIILYARLDGQEEGNVDYVVQHKAGVWAPRPREVVDALQDWVANPAHRAAAAKISRSLARPRAAREIAAVIAEQCGVAK
ncbi:MAG: hypothetical protein LBU38_05735 [Propionibacteriaceae bacterium]|jgi:1,2-diacylglycerol 3-beta-galactosyltransferase|nr:hypothetical protein [Propionibacteriaceae bacterium]